MGRAVTDEEYETIKEMLLSKEFTASQIAAAIGRSRGSVCGIVWRYPELKAIGFARQRNNTAEAKKRKATMREEQRDRLMLRLGVKDGRDMFYGRWMLSGPKTLIMLASHHCRFPVEGEGAETLFCAERRSNESSYCEFHRKLCVVAVKGRAA